MTMSGHMVVGLIWSGNFSSFPRSTLSCQTDAVASRAGLKCWEAELLTGSQERDGFPLEWLFVVLDGCGGWLPEH